MKRRNNRGNADRTQVIHFPAVETVQSQAAKWLAVLDSDDPAPEKIAEFSAWINQSEEHRDEFESMLTLWGELNVLTQTVPPRQKTIRHSDGGVLRHVLWSWPQRAVACLALVVAVLFLVPDKPSVYITGIGEQKKVVLPDGTSVLLNTNSRIEVDYDSKRRNVRLGGGEALFDIERDPDRPFEVYAGDGTVRALGTVFGVYLVGSSVEVLVSEGVVEIEKNRSVGQAGYEKKKSTLSEKRQEYPADSTEKVAVRAAAGTRAVFDQRKFDGVELAEVDMSHIETRHAWRHGVLAFDQQPLEEVVKEMARYTSLKFVIPEKSLREMKVGGIFKLGDTEAMSEALFQGFGIESDRVAADVVYLFTTDRK